MEFFPKAEFAGSLGVARSQLAYPAISISRQWPQGTYRACTL